MLNTNPYQAPQVESVAKVPAHPHRRLAVRNIRVALPIFLLPAVYNILCFHSRESFEGSYPRSPNIMLGVVNLIGLGLLAIAIWFLGMRALEILTKIIYSFMHRLSGWDQWKEALYQSLDRLPVLAVAGAVLWAIWVCAFYQLEVGFLTISIPVGIAGNLLGAWLYVPLIVHWFRIERAAVL